MSGVGKFHSHSAKGNKNKGRNFRRVNPKIDMRLSFYLTHKSVTDGQEVLSCHCQLRVTHSGNAFCLRARRTTNRSDLAFLLAAKLLYSAGQWITLTRFEEEQEHFKPKFTAFLPQVRRTIAPLLF